MKSFRLLSILGVAIIALGMATPAYAQHSVTLAWNASTSTNVVGYNIFRSAVSGGPYQQINIGPNASLSYVDSTVAAGATLYYVVTAVDSAGAESINSNEAKAVIPSPPAPATNLRVTSVK